MPGYLFNGLSYELTWGPRQCLLQFWLVLRTAHTLFWLVHTGNFAKFVERERNSKSVQKSIVVFWLQTLRGLGDNKIKAVDWMPSFFLSTSRVLSFSAPIFCFVIVYGLFDCRLWNICLHDENILRATTNLNSFTDVYLVISGELSINKFPEISQSERQFQIPLVKLRSLMKFK